MECLPMRIVITGASGQLARRVIEELLERGVDPSELILVTRGPEALAEYSARGADVRLGDFTDPSTLPAAFAGGERMLLISTDAIGARVQPQRDAIDAAVAAGIEHVAYTSIVNPEPGSNPAAAVPDHRATEDRLRESGLDWTFLRNSIYADLEAGSQAAALATGRLVTNGGDGSVAYVARDDCAAAAAAVLATDGHAGKAYEITGPARLDAAARAAVFAELGGAPVDVVQVDDAAYAAGLAEATGMPLPVAQLYATFGTATRLGALDALSDDFEALTGRAPRSLRAVLTAATPA
jgi:NAD(P)H dehydrogenase (quinone)